MKVKAGLRAFSGGVYYFTGHSSVFSVGGGVEGFAVPREKMNFVIHSMAPDSWLTLPEMETWTRMGKRKNDARAEKGRLVQSLVCKSLVQLDQALKKESNFCELKKERRYPQDCLESRL